MQLRRLLAGIAQRRAALAAGEVVAVTDFKAELASALADPASTEARARPQLLALLDELGQLSDALNQECQQVRQALTQLGQQAQARSAYVPPDQRRH